MKPSDAFGLVVRIVGFLLILYGVWRLYALVFWLLPGVTLGHPIPALVYGVPNLLIGLGLIRYAPLIVSITYAPKESDKTN